MLISSITFVKHKQAEAPLFPKEMCLCSLMVKHESNKHILKHDTLLKQNPWKPRGTTFQQILNTVPPLTASFLIELKYRLQKLGQNIILHDLRFLGVNG